MEQHDSVSHYFELRKDFSHKLGDGFVKNWCNPVQERRNFVGLCVKSWSNGGVTGKVRVLPKTPGFKYYRNPAISFADTLSRFMG